MLQWLLLLGLLVLLLALFDGKAQSYDRLPGPKRWPFVGNLVDFLGIGSVEIFALLTTYSKRYGKVYKLDLLYDYTIVYSSPEAAEVILTSPAFAAKSEDYDKVSEWIGKGLLVSRGQKWFTHRKVITPGFHFKVLENFVPVFNRHAESFCLKLEALVTGLPGEPINILPELKLHALGVLCETAMGVARGEEQEKQLHYTRIVEELTSILYWRMFNSFANFNVLFRLTPTSRRFNKLVSQSWSFTHDMIDRRRKINASVEEEEEGGGAEGARNTGHDEEFLGRRKRALLDTLLEARIDGKPLTDEEIREEVDTFTFAGHDTTASAMAFILYCVAKHADVQERLYEEIVQEVGTDFGEISAHALNNLRYMELVIKESLRLFPPVPVVARVATESSELLGERIFRGTGIALDIYSMHRNADYFPDPERFDPERFVEIHDARTLNPYTYIPFSAGPRNCIGQRFAQYELKSTLVKLLQRFQLRLTDADYVPTLKAEIVLTPAEGMPLMFRCRK